MKMKKAIVCLIALLSISHLSAQEFTFIPKVGLNLANLVPYGADMRPGMNIGIAGEYRFSQRFAIEPGVYYSMQGYQYKDGKFTAKLKCDYLNIPVYVKAYMFKGFHVFAGPQLGINVSSRIKDMVVSSMPGREVRQTGDIKDNVNTFDFSLCAGAGYALDCGLMVSANYNIGLTNLYKNAGGVSDMMYDNTSNNGVIQVNVGWRFSMK